MDTQAFLDRFKSALTGNYQGEVPSINSMLTGGFRSTSEIGLPPVGNMQGLASQGQGNFNIMNPFTYGNMKRAIEGTRVGDKNMEYSDSPAGQIGKAANERNRLIQEMLGGY